MKRNNKKSQTHDYSSLEVRRLLATMEYPSTDTPIDITDNTSLFSTINVADDGIAADVEVRLNITHTWDADLDVFLTAPSGDQIELFTDVGGGGDNFVETTLDAEATDLIVDGVAPFTGSFVPEGDLTLLYNQDITGDWVLEVGDDAGGDTGTLDDWTLILDVITPGTGFLSLDSEVYVIGDTLRIDLLDENATAPLDVLVESDSGDSEVVALTDDGDGNFSANIGTEFGTNAADGILQVIDGDVITVTYSDADDGSGSPLDVMETAVVSGGQPPAGVVAFNKGTYLLEDTVEITVLDGNIGVDPFDVTVTTDAGDSEVVTLSQTVPGTWVGTIDTVEGAATADDGQINVGLGDVLTVTYEDLDDGAGSSNTLTDDASIANVIEYTSSDTPINITDNTSIFSTISVGDTGSVADINIGIDITHTWDADLDVFLTSPAGTRIELFSDVGGSGDNFVDTLLDQEAVDSIVDGVAPFTGVFRPEGDISGFVGEPITGDWVLEVFDDAGGDTGTLDEWMMFIDVVPAEVGQLSLDASSYDIGETINIMVVDTNAVAPIDVMVEVPSGDLEVVTLSDDGGGIFTGSIDIAAGDAADDGILQGVAGDVITVTYTDTDDGSGNAIDVTATANIINIFIFESEDTPLDIVDNETLNSVISIPFEGTINDVNVELDITHTWDADLDVFLIGPDGTRVELFQDVGGAGDNFTDTILDDEATTSIAAGEAPFTGSFSPIGDLSDFDGMISLGDWTLEISDDAAGDQGTLNSWSLILDLTFATPTPAVNVIGPGTVVEGDDGTTNAVFEIALNQPASEPVIYEYQTFIADGDTATPDVDFENTIGTNAFMLGQYSQLITIPIFGDEVLEIDDTFSFEVFNVINGEVGNGEAVTTITNDEVYVDGTQIDFGPEDGPVTDMGIGVADILYTPENEIGWLPDANGFSNFERNRGNDLLRDVAQLRTGQFVVDAKPMAAYEVTVNLGAILRGGDAQRLTIEDQVFDLVPNVGPNVIIETVLVNVPDLQITFDFNGLGLQPFFRVAGILVEEITPPRRPADSGSPNGDLNNFVDIDVPASKLMGDMDSTEQDPFRPMTVTNSRLAGSVDRWESETAVADFGLAVNNQAETVQEDEFDSIQRLDNAFSQLFR